DGEDEDEPGICIYLDGMAGHIHGNPEQAEKDRAIRAKLDCLGYEVVVVRSFELDDKDAVVRAIARIAKYLVGKAKQREVKQDTSWFERAATEDVVAAPVLTVIDGGRAVSQPSTSPPPHLRLVQPGAEDRYVTCVPLIPVKAAAGAFSGTQALDDNDCDWVELDGRTRPGPGLFVAQVIGESMNRRIPNGAWCLWRANPGGTRQNKVVLVQHRDIDDPELGGRYTVKVYESEKAPTGDGSWRHLTVRLRPDSNDPSFAPIVLSGLDEGELMIIAEFVRVLDDYDST